MIILSILFSSLSLFAAIFGEDNRTDTWKASGFHQELARSVPALILKKNIQQLSEDQFLLKGRPLLDLNFCSDENFAHEKIVANCSASLIAPDKVLTAAHCFVGNDYACSTYNVVFDYQANGASEVTLNQNQIYQCKKMLFYQYDDFFGVDLAVIQLDRPVLDRAPIKISTQLEVGQKLTMIGYPLGITQKVVDDGVVESINKGDNSFRHNLDTFSVNSGGPIFNQQGQQVGVLVRGTGLNYVSDESRACYRWYKGNQSDFAEANDLKVIPARFFE